MEILFLGVGEACDAEHGNTSVFVHTAAKTSVLLDCGFSVAHRYFKFHDNPNDPDYVWISHFHGDHFFGLPLLLLRLFEMGRTKPLIFVGHTEIEKKVLMAMETAYPGFFAKLTFPISFKLISAGDSLELRDLTLQAAATEHSQYNMSLRLADGEKSLLYSGDGRPTRATAELARDCDLVIHEAFKVTDEIPGHGSIQGCLDFAARVKTKQLALVHLERKTRKNKQALIRQLIADAPIPVLLPEDNARLVI